MNRSEIGSMRLTVMAVAVRGTGILIHLRQIRFTTGKLRSLFIMRAR